MKKTVLRLISKTWAKWGYFIFCVGAGGLMRVKMHETQPGHGRQKTYSIETGVGRNWVKK